MMMMRRRLACCTRDRGCSFDWDEQERITTYNGLESCILSNQSYENESGTSRGQGFASDSLDEDYSSSSSSKDAFGSFSSKWLTMKRDDQGLDEWDVSESPQHFYVKEKPARAIQFSDAETMKENFAKLLLGEDITGGSKGLSTALALSNAITNLAASVFGELWKLEPLSQEMKKKWKREMDWLLSPTNHMIELVPAKQNGANGRILEIMTPKARADVQMNLPALKKLDSMLIETLDKMVNTEFWYTELGSRNKSRGQSKRWWLPMPQVPTTGLSDYERTKLLSQSKVVHQIFKAAKAINENVLLEMPVPAIIRDALPKSGKASLDEKLYKALTEQPFSAEKMHRYLNFASENRALEAINRLEAAVLTWRERITEQVNGKSPVRTSWSFVKDPMSDHDKMQLLLDRSEALLQQLKARYPNHPQTFLNATKVQYGKDVGHAILEAYSRVLGNLAFGILSRIKDIAQEDALSNPTSPAATCCFNGAIGNMVSSHIRHSLINQMNQVADGKYVRQSDSDENSNLDSEFSHTPASARSVTSTPSGRRVWCIGKEACNSP
ncbi:hypothetical protein HS088_TW04G01079 [Tripterygium wilfordii]|uniref:PRONE domain-containing protein n=1 Tax=Tripterygium wilfordii TaxID=458696 RepID=A0A7J7DS39_TRIWF|nr:rop guanine nucleotide exchange factor 14-like [Tripterygium wilfordii]KAF5749117.1 hypothetical protein HS088_TW04G01079 [Tripterygium wilfordii]